MRFKSIGDLFELIASGRVDRVTIGRLDKSGNIVRLRMKRGGRWDELWLQADLLDSESRADELLQNAMNTVLDHVSPG